MWPNEFYSSFIEIADLDKRRREYRSIGWIYAAHNPTFRTEAFKVGQSKRPPMARVAELSASTAVYGDFKLVYFVHVAQRDPAEGNAHSLLQAYRITPNKEFFRAPLSKVVAALETVAQMFPIVIGKGSRSRVLQQPLPVVVRRCNECGFENRVRQLLIPIKVKCGRCRRGLGTVASQPQDHQ